MANYDRIIDGKKFLEVNFWLVFTNSGAGPRVTIREPSLKASERSMYMSVLLPVALWATPSLKAKITIEDPGITPIQIDMTAAADALRQAIGAQVEIVLVPPGASE